MAPKPFRFVQASDFHLETPPHGFSGAPDHLVELLVESAYRSAAHVFDIAIAEDVDFLLLVGNLVDPHLAGPRGLAFLQSQFERLAERHIAIYWATTSLDGRHDWPPELRWPENLHLFPAHQVGRRDHVRRGDPICQIAGCGLDRAIDNGHVPASSVTLADFTPPVVSPVNSNNASFSIAVVPDQFDTRAIAEAPVHYWAMGGRISTSTPLSLSLPPRVAHYAGSPQGRCPADIGPHGCTLVQVDERGVARLTAKSTDTIRWHQLRLDVTGEMQRDDMELAMHEQILAVIAAAPDRAHFVSWTIGGEGALLRRAHAQSLAADLSAALQKEFGFRPMPAWTVSIQIDSPSPPSDWFEQDTLLGEYLRAAKQHELMGGDSLNLAWFIPERLQGGALAAQLTVTDSARRSAVVREAAALGAALLHPDESYSDGAFHEPAGHVAIAGSKEFSS